MFTTFARVISGPPAHPAAAPDDAGEELWRLVRDGIGGSPG
jgi:hypothetical protein